MASPDPSLSLPVDPLLAVLREALADARRGRKERGVHRLRVVTRRLDVWLRLAGMRALRDDLRWLRAMAGPVRDLDVLLAQHAGHEGAEGLHADRALALVSLVAGLDAGRTAALVTALSLLPPISAARAWAGAQRLADRLVALPCDPTNPDDVHRRRRLVRRLRYAMELVGGPTAALVALQDRLGLVSDALVAHRWQAPTGETLARSTTLVTALETAEAAWRQHLPAIEELRQWTCS